MRKLRLDPESLAVQSFETATSPAAKGTVFGAVTRVFDGCTYDVGCGSGGALPSFCGYQCGSDNPGCGGTDWETCHNTCNTCDQYTCLQSCGGTCFTCNEDGSCPGGEC